MKKPSTFYYSLPKRITDPAERLLKYLRTSGDPFEVIKFYFEGYWDEFVPFWQQSGEKISTMYNFCGNPDNSVWLIEYVFVQHPEVMEQIIKGMDEAGV